MQIFQPPSPILLFGKNLRSVHVQPCKNVESNELALSIKLKFLVNVSVLTVEYRHEKFFFQIEHAKNYTKYNTLLETPFFGI